MNACFADTAYYLALFNPSDEAHTAANALTAALNRQIVTTSAVVLELGSALAYPPDRALFRSLLLSMQTDPAVTLILIDHDLFEAGFKLFCEREDKSWSLTDCVSFACMARMKISDALTTDHHFEQAGYRILLKPEEMK